MKKAIIALCTILTAGICMAQNVRKPEMIWNEVISGYSNCSSALNVTEIRMYKDRTELSIHVDYVPGYWIKFNDNLYMQADGKKYALTGAEGLKIGEEFWMPESGQADIVLIFEPLPSDCRSMDFIEPGGWMIMNLRSTEFKPEDIADTYWRCEETGEWIIGFTPECVIYDGRFWEISSQAETNDTYTVTISDSGISIPIEVGRMKKGKRTIHIGGETFICTPITTASLPDYPMKDVRKGIRDNGYKEGEYVTLTGWLKDMPEELWKQSGEFELSYSNVLNDEYEVASGKLDSLGRFSFKVPLLNSTQVFMDWRRSHTAPVLEPGNTYFFLHDYSTGQKLFMGDDARLQNELLTHPHSWDRMHIDDERGEADAMKAWKEADALREKQLAELDEIIAEHPYISQRYIDYVKGFYHMNQASSMSQARYYMADYELPEAYMEYLHNEFWKKLRTPYTLYRDFSVFMRDYMSSMTDPISFLTPAEAVETLLECEKKGKTSFTDEERELLKKFPKEVEAFLKEYESASEEDKARLAAEFDAREDVKIYQDISTRHTNEISARIAEKETYSSIEVIDSSGCDKALRDIHIARSLYRNLDRSRTELSDRMVELAENEIGMPAARNSILALNEKYAAIGKRKLAKAESLKSAEPVKDMSEGEQILRKLIEPYKGKIILLDIWGVWCGPCRAALSHSQEQYERLKDHDIIFMYLANRSEEESWKNIIKEYNVTGGNVVHYNLPTAQQTAIENFLKINSFPSYRLIDQEGNILEVNADPRLLDQFVQLIESLE